MPLLVKVSYHRWVFFSPKCALAIHTCSVFSCYPNIESQLGSPLSDYVDYATNLCTYTLCISKLCIIIYSSIACAYSNTVVFFLEMFIPTLMFEDGKCTSSFCLTSPSVTEAEKTVTVQSRVPILQSEHNALAMTFSCNQDQSYTGVLNEFQGPKQHHTAHSFLQTTTAQAVKTISLIL